MFWNLLNMLISCSSYGRIIYDFSMYEIKSPLNTDSFTSAFPIWLPFFLSFLFSFNCFGENFQYNIEQKWWEGSLCVCIHVLSFTTKNKERTSKRPQAIQKSWKVIGKETEKAKILCFIMGQRKMCHCNFY